MSSTAFFAVTFRFGRRAEVDGMAVRALLPSDEEWRRIHERIATAFRLIQAHSPVRWRHFKRDIQRVWILGLPTARGMYIHDHAMCVLDFDYVVADDTRPEELALTLIHEGSHARLRRHGFGYDEAVRGRIERICIRNELVVARRLTNHESLVEQREARLHWEDSEWSDDSRRLANIDALGRLDWLGRAAYRITTMFRRAFGGRF